MACCPPGRYQFQIRRTLGAGTHYLKVEGYDENETGPLHRPSHRRRQPGNTTATAQALTLGQAQGGNISPAQDTDHFSITVEENTHVSIWAVHDSASLKVNGELLNGTGQSVVGDYLQELAGNHGFAIEHLLTAGTRYLKVKGSTSTSTGRYTVQAAKNTAYRWMVEQCARIEGSPGIDDALSGCQWRLKKRTLSPAEPTGT